MIITRYLNWDEPEIQIELDDMDIYITASEIEIECDSRGPIYKFLDTAKLLDLILEVKGAKKA